MNLRQTIAKQQEVWIKKLDGKEHLELPCYFCDYMEEKTGNHKCEDCPVVRVLTPGWTRLGNDGYDACFYLPSWREWHQYQLSIGQRAAAARLVLADVNRIARHYHYPVREP
jgi:hypothetical protein